MLLRTLIQVISNGKEKTSKGTRLASKRSSRIKEFKALSDRDKSKNKARLWKELTYIYLAIDWKSLYNQYSEQERHQESLSDSGITEEEFNDPLFREACRKYKALQDSNKSIKMLRAAMNAAD